VMIEAVILAGGEGARLRPLTCDLPKPMVPVANRPIMHYALARLRELGVSRAYVTLHYLASEVESCFGDGSDYGVPLAYAIEDTPLGTAGSVRGLMTMGGSQWPSGTFLVISGDALTNIELGGAVEFHRKHGAIATIVLARVANPLEYGVVVTDGDGRVRRFLEKPSGGEVFSDTVNTGIYILEPEALARVPQDQPHDFSKDLFAGLLVEGAPLLGYVAEGYWTDVGTVEQYQAANMDALQGKTGVDLLGEQVRDGVWMGAGTRIHPSASIEGPVLIGNGCTIGERARVGPLTVIGDNCVIEAGARIERSVVWSGTFVGTGTRVQAATVCRNAVVKRHVTIGEGAVIGNRCLIEDGTTVMPGIGIWPDKVTERGARVTMNLIWGARWPGSLFGASGVTGLANAEINPEFAAKLAAAFGAELEAGAQVITSRDSHHASRMVKRAMIAGLMSVGSNVLDLRIMPGPVARHMANISGAAGGLHVAASPSDTGQVLIEFFDGRGRNLDSGAERKIEQVFLREDFRRAPLDGVGSLEFLGRTMEYYTEDFLNFLNADEITRWRPKLVIDYAYGPLCLLMPMVLGRLGCDSTALNAFVDPARSEQVWSALGERLVQVGGVVHALKTEVGLLMGGHADRFAAADETGRPIAGDDLLLVFLELVLHAQGPGARIAAPFSATAGVEDVCERYGTTAVRTKVHPRWLMEAAGGEPEIALAGDDEGGIIFPKFLPAFDAMLAVGKLLELLASSGQSLGDVYARIPKYHRARAEVECPWDRKGLVMRRLQEETAGMKAEHLDGVKVHLDGGWVLVRPDESGPLLHVKAESGQQEAAEALVREYAGRIAKLREGA